MTPVTPCNACVTLGDSCPSGLMSPETCPREASRPDISRPGGRVIDSIIAVLILLYLAVMVAGGMYLRERRTQER